jgi:hypothetical protein
MIAAAVAASFLTVSTLTSAEVRPVVIDNDGGGNVATFVMWYKRIKESGVPVRLRGVCDSACTFILMLPREQVCVEPTASLGFHLASYADEAAPSVTGALIRRWYPEAVRKWLVGQTLIEAPLYMPASVMVRLGIFPACEGK